jgi:hypothetical protein
VGGPLHEAWLRCDPAESEADLIDKANAVHATDGTGRELLTRRQSAVRRRPYATVSSSSSDRGFQIGAVARMIAALTGSRDGRRRRAGSPQPHSPGIASRRDLDGWLHVGLPEGVGRGRPPLNRARRRGTMIGAMEPPWSPLWIPRKPPVSRENRGQGTVERLL